MKRSHKIKIVALAVAVAGFATNALAFDAPVASYESDTCDGGPTNCGGTVVQCTRNQYPPPDYFCYRYQPTMGQIIIVD